MVDSLQLQFNFNFKSIIYIGDNIETSGYQLIKILRYAQNAVLRDALKTKSSDPPQRGWLCQNTRPKV